MGQLSGKWALITGSSRGIGQQLAIGLAKLGCNVIIHGRTIEHTITTMSKLGKQPVEAFAVAGELGKEDEEQAFLAMIIEKVGKVDILYNNAAIMSQWNDTPFHIPLEEWMKVMNVNFYAMVRINNMLIPPMVIQGWGRVINLTSGIQDTPQLLPYGVSKAAVDKYTLDLKTQLKDSGVLVNTLDPGWLKTDMGGPNADGEVESVLPGALVPALLPDDGPSGQLFRAQELKTPDSHSVLSDINLA